MKISLLPPAGPRDDTELVPVIKGPAGARQTYAMPIGDFTLLAALLAVTDVDPTLAANSDELVATQKATRAFVEARINALVNAAPEQLNTINELSAALGNDQNFAATVTAALALKADGATVTAALAAKAPARLTVEAVAGAYTFDTADENKHKRFTNAADVVATVPLDATKPFPIGGRIRITAAGTGAVTLAPESGAVVLNSRNGALKSAGQFAVLEIEKVGPNEWDVLGDVTE